VGPRGYAAANGMPLRRVILMALEDYRQRH
jgi:hypothetical protein